MYRNIYTAVQILISAMETLQIPYETEEVKQRVAALEDVTAESALSIPEEDQQVIRSLWADGGVQKCFHRRREYQITDSAK